MSVLTFTLGLVQALAWPALVALIIIVLRNPIREMLSEITRSASRMRAKAGPVEVELERLVVQSVEEFKEVGAEPIAPYSPVIRPPAAFRLNYLLVKNPATAIVQGYAEIEGHVRTLLGNAGIEASGLADLPALSRQACDHELVPVQVVTMAASLSVARARIDEADGNSVSGTTAYAFMSMCDILDYMIEAYKPGSRN